MHFGLGDLEEVDSIEVRWFDGTTQKWKSLQANTTHELIYQSESLIESFQEEKDLFFNQVNKDLMLIYKDEDDDFIDFNLQITIPYKLSQSGPAIAVGDLNSDGLEDLLIGGSREKKRLFFIKKATGHLPKKHNPLKANHEI